MRHEQLEAYLDGELAPQEREAVDRAIVSDAEVARTLSALKSERALRQAAFATYVPDDAAARSEAQAILAKCFAAEAAPVAGRVGWVWARRIGAVAAMVVIAAGSFYAGRTSTPQGNPTVIVQKEEPKAPAAAAEPQYVVMIIRGSEVIDQVTFASSAEMKEYAEKYAAEQQAAGDMVLAGVL